MNFKAHFTEPNGQGILIFLLTQSEDPRDNFINILMLIEFGYTADNLNNLEPPHVVMAISQGLFITLYDYFSYVRRKRGKEKAVRMMDLLQKGRESDCFKPMWFDEKDLEPFWWEENSIPVF